MLPGGRAYPVIPIAFAPSGGLLNCNMHVPTGGLPVTGGALTASRWTGPEPAAALEFTPLTMN